MELDVREAKSLIDKHALENLLQLYMYDSTEYTDVEINSEGRYNIIPDFDIYWTKPETNHPFLIIVNNQIAGFVFVKYIKTEERSYNYLAHFFVLRKYRKMGTGRQAAKIIFNSLKGIWELYQLEKNLSAHKFWTNIITELTNGLYEEKHENGRIYQTFIL